MLKMENMSSASRMVRLFQNNNVILAIFCLAVCLGSTTVSANKYEHGDSSNYLRTEMATTAIEKGTGLRQLLPLQGFGGDPDPTRLPLQLCEGDCDDDSECDVGLVCFQRDEFEAVPGCEGGEEAGAKTDYCFANPNASTETPSVSPTTSTLQPSQSASPSSVPTLSPKPTITSPPVTMAPTQLPLLEVVGNNGSPESAFPLGLCQGDCDDDDDCDWGLYCVQRNDEDDPVTGCDIGDPTFTDRDFCASMPADQLLPRSFRLKMYWEDGYMWQDSPDETEWCATFDYDGYPGTGQCWYGDETERCNPEEMYIADCRKDLRQAFVFVPVSSDEVLVQLGNGDDRCWERDGRAVLLRPCDPINPLQRWYPLNGSFQSGDKFELSQKDFDTQCVANAHHPKPGEVVEMHFCEALRLPDSETSYWVKY